METFQLHAASAFDPGTEMSFTFSVNTKAFTQPHCHDFYEITLVTAGKVQHYINGTMQELPCNTMTFIRPSDSHFYKSTGQEAFEYINLAFTQKTMQLLLQYLDNSFDRVSFDTAPMPPTTRLNPSDTFTIRQSIEKLSLFPSADMDKKRIYFRLLTAELFFKYYDTECEEKKIQPAWFSDLLQSMNDPSHFCEGISCLERISGKSLAYISRLFQEKIHTTPTDYINDLRLNYCANRLIHSDTAIIDISMDAGFNNLSHFYHLFKEKYGMPPNQYRKEKRVIL